MALTVSLPESHDELPVPVEPGRELSPAECVELLTHGTTGRLSVVTAGRSELVPVHYLYDEQLRRVVIPVGTANLGCSHASWPWASFEVHGEATADTPEGTVTISGEIRELEYRDDIDRISASWPGPWSVGSDVRWLSIDGTTMSGLTAGG